MEERNSVSCDNVCCTPLQKRENVPLHGLHEKMHSFGFSPHKEECFLMRVLGGPSIKLHPSWPTLALGCDRSAPQLRSP